MEFNALLPALVPAAIALIVVSVGAALVLAFNRRPDLRMIVRRTWIVVTIVILLGVVIFWVATVFVQGPMRATPDRTLQQKQQDELHKRLEQGSH